MPSDNRHVLPDFDPVPAHVVERAKRLRANTEVRYVITPAGIAALAEARRAAARGDN